jgi:hypothetical protein
MVRLGSENQAVHWRIRPRTGTLGSLGSGRRDTVCDTSDGGFNSTVIHKLSKRLSLRQQVTATAIVYLRRFYLKSNYCGRLSRGPSGVCFLRDLQYSDARSLDTDPCLIAAACIYLASKSEETPAHIKNVVTEARAVFSGTTGMPTMHAVKCWNSC